uniref:Neur_chan_LBD domain-containing protein n=1 Tax=Panagrellus redivivus TaxID=6233 RepID=A0A7E4V1Y0_PANRE
MMNQTMTVLPNSHGTSMSPESLLVRAPTAKRVTLTEDTINLPGSLSPTPSTPVISFGYASAAPNFRKHSEDCELGPSTSNIETLPSSEEHGDSSQTGLFYLRTSEKRSMEAHCHQPVGTEADHILESIGNRYKERLRRFIENEKPEEGEHYVWIQSEVSGRTTVLSITQLENHFNNDKVKRVKWRHLSIDRISVYRYSVPIITTKFRLRMVHFLSQNYRCCILCVWCFVILFISLGIIVSVVFGSLPYNSSTPFRNVTAGFSFQN